MMNEPTKAEIAMRAELAELREQEAADLARTNNPQTLSDLMDFMPLDGPTGQILSSSDGVLDDPKDYGIIEHMKTDDGFRALVVGPSGDIDLVVDDVSGTRIYRDTDSILEVPADTGFPWKNIKPGGMF